MQLNGSLIFNKERINTLLSYRLSYLYFPSILETHYQQEYQREAAREFRYRAPIILGLYFFLSFGIYQVLPDEQIPIWLMHYGWVGVIIFIAWLFSFIPLLNTWFDYYICIGSSLAVAITFSMITVLEHGQNNVLFHAAMMYAVIIIYGFVGMRFYIANIAGWTGGLIGIIISLSLHSDIEWTLLNRTYTFSSLLGMALAYATDRQYRKNYLQNCLIATTQQELIQQSALLTELSRQDALTGLSNRRYLDEMLKQEWKNALRQQYSLCIMMVDIDYFKLYNDSLGHQEGDKCLQKIATILATVTKRHSDIIARYGGEEFLLVLPHTTKSQAIILAEQLIAQIKASHIFHPQSDIAQHVTVSIGIATHIPQPQDTIFDFIKRADQALYTAKINGRNRYHCAENS